MNNFIDYQKLIYLIKNIYIKDVIDIFLLSILVFFTISIINKTRSYKIIFGFSILVFLFLVANWVNLTLTKNLLQFYLPFVILSLIVIFQRELRIFLEQIAIIVPKRKKNLNNKDVLIDNILNAIKYLSQNKIGAILVFEKNITLDSIIQGAKLLNSEISTELIITIFNKNSPLHDGAIIIKNDKIKYASAHLPLPDFYDYNQRLGTRHRSAIGLS
ncbi:MAG: ABC transporter permease [Candidatus Parcubacteria bacterium]|nr:MAG: ABC transporter permease [Candidatus Parcubacteria bacterium]